jgi:cell division protein FtsL
MALALRSPASGRDRRTLAPQLAAVPSRRRFARFAVALTVLIGGVMIGAVLLHTRLAERQLDIDAVERALREEQQQFDLLRATRAELRAPTRLAEQAADLGMIPGTESEFVMIDPMLLAITIARTGEMPAGDDLLAGGNARMRPLDQFRLVKSLDAGAP